MGETAYLLREAQAFDVDVLEDGTELLALSERTLSALAEAAPTVAARVASNLYRQLCRRLAATTSRPAVGPDPAEPAPQDRL